MRWTGRGIAVVALAFGWLLVHAPPAMGCTCAGPRPAPAVAVAGADGAFVGTLVAIDDPDRDGDGNVVFGGRPVFNHFDVEAVAKGDIGTTVVVESAASGATCGIDVSVGGRAGLLVYRKGDGWASGLCSKVDPDALRALSVLPRTGGAGELGINLGLALVLGGLAVGWTVRMNAREG